MNFSATTATAIAASESASTYVRNASKRESIARTLAMQTASYKAAFNTALEKEAAFFALLKKEIDFM